MDITNFMSWFIGICVEMFTWVYNTLDSITFYGFSLLQFCISILIISTIIPIILTTAQNQSIRSERCGKTSKSERSEKNEE